MSEHFFGNFLCVILEKNFIQNKSVWDYYLYERRGMVMFKWKERERRKKYGRKVLIAGVVFILYIKIGETKSIQQVSFVPIQIEEQEEDLQEELVIEWEIQKESKILFRQEPLLKEQEKLEEWYGMDRKLTDSEWDALTQMILSEARGESFEVQYYIACVVLNRVDSDYFPNTVEEVIYQTNPVQFQGAWDKNHYEPSQGVLEAIQTALEENRTPSDMYYFTSEGWLPGTEAWKQVGGMWFSCQE